MGLSGVGIWQMLIVLLIVLVLFGGKRLRQSGADLGATLRDFKQALGNRQSPADTNE